MFLMWILTVLNATNSSLAICRSDLSAASRASTSSSRSLKGSRIVCLRCVVERDERVVLATLDRPWRERRGELDLAKQPQPRRAPEQTLAVHVVQACRCLEVASRFVGLGRRPSMLRGPSPGRFEV
jgi:hypothetical protein